MNDGGEDPGDELLGWFETHDVGEVARMLEARAVDATLPFRDKLWTTHFTEMYTRSPRFGECLRLLLDHGCELEHPALRSVLLDDAPALRAELQRDPEFRDRRVDMKCPFVSLRGATLLHVAAEFGRSASVRVLLDAGVDPNVRSAIDAHGRNGHSPIFHVVNAHANHARDILGDLLDAGARADLAIPMLQWGEGFDWETTFFDVTPISFTQMGLLPQVHRREEDIYENIRRLLTSAGRVIPPLPNVPNRYVR